MQLLTIKALSCSGGAAPFEMLELVLEMRSLTCLIIDTALRVLEDLLGESSGKATESIEE